MKIIKALLLLIIVSSCSSTQNTEPSPIALTPLEEKGIAVATISFETDTPANELYRFFYKATSGDKKFQKANAGKVIISGRNNKQSAYNGDFNNKKSYLVVIERDPGSYAFNQYSYLNHLGPSGAVFISDEFAIPFEIRKGEITYLGEISFNDLAQKGSPKIFVADYFSRDLAQFKKKYPALKWENTKNQTPIKGNTGNGTVDFRANN